MAADANGIQNLLHLVHPFSGPEVPAVIMAVAFPAADHIDAVGAFFEGAQDVQAIDFSGTGDPDYFDGCGVRHAHRTCQVRSRVPSEVAAKCDDDRIEFLIHKTPSSKASTLHSIWSSSYQLSSMAFAGHSAAQIPQPWQSASSISLTPSRLTFGTP